MRQLLITILLFLVLAIASTSCRVPDAPDSLKKLRVELSQARPATSSAPTNQQKAAQAHLHNAETQLKDKNTARADQLAMLGLIALRIDALGAEAEAQRKKLEDLNREEAAAAIELEQVLTEIALLETEAARAELLNRVESAIAEARSAALLLDGKNDAALSAAELEKLEKARLAVSAHMIAAAVAQRDQLLSSEKRPSPSDDWTCFLNAIPSAEKSLKQKKSADVQKELERGFVCLRRVRAAMPVRPDPTLKEPE